MINLTYSTRLQFDNDDDKQKVIDVLKMHRDAVNEASKICFGLPKYSIVELHAQFYQKYRDSQVIPSQVVIRAEQEILSLYRSAKSNKHQLKEPIKKKRLSIRLDKRIYSWKNNKLSLISSSGRVKCSLQMYTRLEELMRQSKFLDPLIFVKGGEVWISLTFEKLEIPSKGQLALGVDLGCRNYAATSDGQLFQDKKFNGEKRALRHLKRKLQSKGTKSAKQHLKKVSHKERNKNKNFCHHLANKILQTNADTIVLEDLSKIKRKKHKFQNKNRISQAPFFQLKQILCYKAPLQREAKTVISVSPHYTSQIDCRTGLRDGERKGCRYIGKDGQLLHADCNAASVIALRSQLPCSIGNYFAWQVIVNSPIVV